MCTVPFNYLRYTLYIDRELRQGPLLKLLNFSGSVSGIQVEDCIYKLSGTRPEKTIFLDFSPPTEPTWDLNLAQPFFFRREMHFTPCRPDQSIPGRSRDLQERSRDQGAARHHLPAPRGDGLHLSPPLHRPPVVGVRQSTVRGSSRGLRLYSGRV